VTTLDTPGVAAGHGAAPCDATSEFTGRPDQWSALPPAVAEVCATAVDPLEIAATMEVCGVSDREARDRFHQPDLFVMARELFRTTPFRLARPTHPRRQLRPGASVDLGRGALFALHSLIFAAAIRGSGLQLPWWACPLALTCGWAFSQGVASTMYSLRNRGATSDAAVLWGLVVALVGGAGVGLLGVEWLGPRSAMFGSVGVVAAFSVYVTAFAILLVHEELAAVTATLIPCVLLALLYFNGWPVVVPGKVVTGIVGAALLLVLVASLRHAARQWWRRPRLLAGDRRLALRHVITGICSGLAISVTAVLAGDESRSGSLVVLSAYPIVITLGVLEWQLRSYRFRANQALDRTGGSALFAGAAFGAFLRALGWYVTSLACVSGVIAGVVLSHGQHLPVTLLVTDDLLGVVFFVGLVVASCSRVDLVMRSWLAGVVTFAVGLLAAHILEGTVGFGGAEIVAAVATSVVLICLALVARRVVDAPFSYA